MFRPYEVFIGLRYTRARKRDHFISFIAILSIIGIALGVLVMITVLSVMNGFQTEVRDRLLGAASHATINGIEGNLSDWQTVITQARQHPRVIGAAPFIRTEGMLTHGQFVHASFVRGVIPEQEGEVSEIGNNMLVGKLDDLKPGEFGIVLGKYLARSLGVSPGSKVTLITPQANVTPAGILPRLKRFTVVGIFEIGHNQYDGGLAIIHMRDAAKLMRLDDAASGVRIKLDDIFMAPLVSRELVENLSGGYYVSDWTRVHANFFRAVEIEKKMMLIITTLIVLVAAFLIIVTMVMAVNEKQSDIAILRTLGASPLSIMKIFVVQGFVIGFLGVLLGVIAGLALSFNISDIVGAIENLMGIKFLSPDVYIISNIPSEVQNADVVFIAATAFILNLLATLYPAWRAASTQPAEALRYE
ncbi:MAG: lipoprotein-releasing ABC transporter permease subunit [Granulosicoccaceae bacterium]|jgi:lipoprotein-releasing system permease protein